MSLLDRAARFIDDVLLLPEDVRRAIEDAEAALEAGRAKEAELALRAVLVERPSLLRARQGLALALLERRDVEGARAILAVSRQLDPDEPEIALLSARLALEAGELEAAVEEARDAARRLAADGGAPFAEACAIRARAERRRGRPDRAARELRKAIAASADDEALRVELSEALAAAGKGALAAAAIRGIEPSSLGPDVAARLGVALFEVGEGARAKPLLSFAATEGRVAALRALARLSLAAGALADAEMYARTAVARRGGADALVVLAEVLAASDRAGEAAQVLVGAADASHGTAGANVGPLIRRAARLASLDDDDALEAIAARLDEVAPGDPLARALRAWVLVGRGALDGAAALLAGVDAPRGALAGARLALARGVAGEALSVLARADGLEPHDVETAARLRRDALRALWRGPTGQIDLPAAIDEVTRFAAERRLHDVHRRAGALRDELDRPLLLAILGEFNAGKSTLVNAFLGADVAPTGILPTTATLNVLRGGAERRVRVVRKDGTTREGDHSQLKALLGEADSEGEAGALVDHVEIMLPSELLERVWILDTPGSNAPVPEHEALAAEALRRADAALWIFDSGQAGKATEGKILQAIRESRRHVLGALNKVDRLKDGQLEQVQESLRRELPELEGEVVALSAKKALKARLAGDEEAHEASGFPALMRRLEADVFSRSRQLKHRACGGRLLKLLDDALASEAEEGQAIATRTEKLEAAAERLEQAAAKLPDRVDEALAAFEEAQGAAFDAAAEEVLAFVRPRTNRFAKHGADLEDRAFLAEVIDLRLGQAIERCRAQLVARLRGGLAASGAEVGLDAAALDRQVHAAIAPPLAAFAGYSRGLLAGGALRRFFEDDLPRAELAVEPLAEALAPARAHPREHLRPALLEAVAELGAALETERAARVAQERAAATRLREQGYEPLRALREVLEELV